MHDFQYQNCELTLQEGLNIYYQSFPDDTKVIQDEDGPKWLFGHDCTHVIFGLDISMMQESILDTWSLWGTDFGIKGAINLFIASRKNTDFNKLYKKIYREYGITGLIKLYFSSLPFKRRARAMTKKMTKKWPYIPPQHYLNRSIRELRQEFNIKILSQYELNN